MTNEKLKQIKEFVDNKTCNIRDLQHDCEHAQRVADNAKRIVQILELEERVDIYLLTAICLLHDINYATHKPSLLNYFIEGKRTKKILPKILDDLGIEEGEINIIENAISNSSFSFPFKKLNKDKDLFTQILQDADTIDYFSKERESSFKRSKENYLFYKILSPLSKFTFRYGRKNLKKYLNFPRLAQNLYVSEN